MPRIVLAIEIDTETEATAVEYRIDSNLREYRYKLHRYELEDGDELLKLSVAKDAITQGLAEVVDKHLRLATPEQRLAMQFAQELSDYRSPPDDTPEPVYATMEDARAALEARRAERELARRVEQAERNAREQEAARKRYEELDRRAEDERRARAAAKADSGCPGGCSRGGEGPACGRPGCY